jgi:hypothetical protein
MSKDQMTFLYRHQVLQDATKAVRAGAQLTLPEATVVLEVTRSKRCKQWPDGSHHYYSNEPDAGFLIADVVIPEAVELSAIKVVRESAPAAPIIARKKRIEWDWIRDQAHVLAGQGGQKSQAEIIRELQALHVAEFPDERPPAKGNKKLRKIVNEALANAGQ